MALRKDLRTSHRFQQIKFRYNYMQTILKYKNCHQSIYLYIMSLEMLKE